MQNNNHYKTELTLNEERLQYLFVSTGTRSIIKAIEYSPITIIGKQTVYNLGFGDYDEATKNIIDDSNSNNGDMYTVFNTVLQTVPMFFKTKPDCVLYVCGSDSTDDFTKKCKPNCKKKCVDSCKLENRRIKIYRYFVDKHFIQLSKEYIFFGKNRKEGNSFVQYIPGKEYHDILVYKKK
ncbi:hypothetical protein D1J36_004135 [Riemerella anatipestifer]|uniref:DUF6934 family protein n=1 Tax=Riemerella anatipestifer TaxID=34085 RepID=UPI0012AE83A7|nr:hypothetical protein [Riemerella anatipestifer]USL96299.1 hypothetical protein D1J36_004135 [Riemerella anatipestifer]